MAGIYEVFSSLVEPHCPGVVEPSLVLAVRDAARELCRKSDVWQLDTVVQLKSGIPEYSLDLPADAEVVRVISATYGETAIKVELTGVANSALARIGAVAGLLPRSGPVDTVFFYDPLSSDFRVYPVPDADVADTLVVRASFSPLRNATELPEALISEYQETLACGAIYRLMATPNKSYSSPLASEHLREFQKGVARAHRQNLTGRVRGSIRLRERSFV